MTYNLTVSVVLFNTNIDEILNIERIITASQLKTKLFFIDNSPHREAEKVIKQNEAISYIHTGKNLGFGKAHNIGIEFAKKNSEYHLILNADVDFNAHILEEMIRYMNANTDIGLMAPKVLNPDGSLQYTAKLLPTPFYLFFRRFIPIDPVKDRLNQKYELKDFDLKTPLNIPFFIGCFLMLRSSVLVELGGYDSRYFMYMEDIDLVRRIHEHHQTLYYPFCAITHKHGKGSYLNKRLLMYHLDSSIRYFNKWGWLFDKNRKKVNNKVLDQIKK